MTKKLKVLINVTLILALTSCTFMVPAYNAVNELKRPFLDSKCRSYGAKPGTDAYVNCMATLAAPARR